MTTESVLRKVDLDGPGTEYLDASGIFYFNGRHTWTANGADRNIPGAIYNVTFKDEHGLSRFLDFYLAEGNDATVARLYLKANRAGVELPSANLRFQLNREHQVAAAVIIAATSEGDHYWMTHGNCGREDVRLSHDSWDPDDNLLPPESFITVGELREVLTQWVFGDVLPPPAVEWVRIPEIKWF